MSQGAPRSPMKKKRRTTKALKASCDRLWAKIVLSKGACEHCGATADERQLHPHHVYGRDDHRLRFDLRNGCCLCARCHKWWAHSMPMEFAAWFNQHRPRDATYLMLKRHEPPANRRTADYEKLEHTLKLILEAQDGEVQE